MSLCPCHSQIPYTECCKPLHEGLRPAKNALELMRSRYSAYALFLVKYIIETTHRSNPIFQKPTSQIEKDTLSFCRHTQFEGLDIVEFIDGDVLAYVTFVAHLKQGSQDASFQEKSSFVKENNRWLYKGGEIPGKR